jgi:hypothetical protein
MFSLLLGGSLWHSKVSPRFSQIARGGLMSISPVLRRLSHDRTIMTYLLHVIDEKVARGLLSHLPLACLIVEGARICVKHDAVLPFG